MAGWNLGFGPPPIPTSFEPQNTISWQPWHAGQPVHHMAVRGGTDIDGAPLYVGRLFHQGDQIPAKVIPSHNVAYVGWGSKEHGYNSCEIMISSGYIGWAPSANGVIPHNAIQVGRTAHGEPLYTGRVVHKGGLIIGKVHPSHGCLYIPFGGKEHSYKNYEILIRL